MSKKIMKRSLALGALMAFVITGSVWAADYNHPKGEWLNMESFTSNAVYGIITVDNSDASASNDLDHQAVVSKTANDALKATTSITINSRNSGICSNAIGSKIVVSAPTISIDKVGYLSGIHLDRVNAQVFVENFNNFSINATANGKDSWSEGNGIRVNRSGAEVNVIGNPNSTVTINTGSSGLVITNSDKGKIKLSASNVYITSTGANNTAPYKGQAVASHNNTNSEIEILATNEISITNNNNGNTSTNPGYAVYANSGSVNIGTAKDTNGNDLKKKANIIINGDIKTVGNGKIDLKLETYNSRLNGHIQDNSKGTELLLSNGATWNVTGDSFVNELNGSGGNIVFDANAKDVHIDAGTASLNLTMKDKTADDLNDAAGLTTVAERLGVKEEATKTISAKVVMAEGDVKGETTGVVTFVAPAEGNTDTYYHGIVEEVSEKVNAKNQAISDAGIGLKLHYRYHMNDMNKRMGELRNANGEYGVWTRMVRGESEYKNTKAQYNQYQLGYDEKLSVDKRWTVGAAVTFSEGDSSYGYGSTEDKCTAFAIYGSKLNNDGTFVDLIARYAHLESDVEDKVGKGDYSTNGMSVSAEFGKRIQQGNGLWIEPQFELTYGNFDSAEFQIGGKTVLVGDMDSLIGRVGFSLGKDIKQGNVYARASYLYDFDGETETAFTNGIDTRKFKDDLGGGWWEVGVGANINLSKATYIYADVEKTFGGEVDTNWQWNLGIRYSF